MSKEEEVVVNVEGMPVRSRERAEKAAKNQAKPLGTWLGRASGHSAVLEDSPHEFPPLALLPCRGLPDELSPAWPDAQAAPVGGSPGFDASAQGLSAVAAMVTTAGAVPPKSDIRRACRLLDEHGRFKPVLGPRLARVRPSVRAAAGTQELVA